MQAGQEPLLRRAADVERGRDPHRLAARRGPLRDRATSSTRTGRSFLKVIVNPLVNLIWLAGLVFLLGSVVAMWPDAREQRRLAARFAGEGAARRAGLVEAVALALGALLAVACVVFVARPLLRPRPRGRRSERRVPDEEARLRLARGARPRARGAQGARVRPPHRQDLRRGLPRARRAAAASGRGGAAGPRA